MTASMKRNLGQRRGGIGSIGLICSLLMLAWPTASARGQCDPEEVAKLTASDAAAHDWFGDSVAVSGDTAVIGAEHDDGAASDSGSAYVFVRSAGVWTQQAKLTALDAARGDYFGSSVAVDGDTAFIGAILDDDHGNRSGSAYVFVRSAGVWTQQAKLTASDGAAGDDFGFSVAVSGDTAFIGIHYDDDNGYNSGSAYVFVRSGGVWKEQAKLTASDAAGGDYFGHSVAVSGDTAVHRGVRGQRRWPRFRLGVCVRAYGHHLVAGGQAHRVRCSGGDYFGVFVSVSGDTAVIGAPLNDRSGSAYVFVRSGGVWTEQAKLTASDGEAGDWLSRVSASGDTAVIGAAYGAARLAIPARRTCSSAPAGSGRSKPSWPPRMRRGVTTSAGRVAVSGDTAVIRGVP